MANFSALDSSTMYAMDVATDVMVKKWRMHRDVLVNSMPGCRSQLVRDRGKRVGDKMIHMPNIIPSNAVGNFK